MAETQPILLATLAGFVCGLIFSSIPVGPINLTILNEGARRGFLWADRYHARALRTPKEVRHVLVYVLFNIKKH